ncbi:hypothetical protein N9H30_00585 [bacterium]|nr:hypothetical protein [bacterium]
MARKKIRSVYVTVEPKWKELKLLTDIEEQAVAFRSCEYFVRTEINKTKLMPIVKEWIKTHSGWSKEEVKIILANPDWAFSSYSTSIYIHHKLGYMPEKIREHYEKRKSEWIERGKKCLLEKKDKIEEKKAKPVISIQDRMKEQVSDLCGNFEGFLDDMIDGDKTIKDFDPYKMMMSYQPEIKGPHAKIIKDEFDAQYQEALEVLEWKDEDLKEAYGHFDLKMRKAFVQYYETINTACDTIIKTKATTRKARKPKARSKEAIVKKLKYQVNDPQFALASLPPTDIVYANEVWVYNTKTRKIGVYKALNVDPKNLQRSGTGIMVKGTTLQDFNEKESVQKTLRKPAEMLPYFDAGKLKCKKSFEELTTTPTKMNGRFNEHTIILKTF